MTSVVCFYPVCEIITVGFSATGENLAVDCNQFPLLLVTTERFLLKSANVTTPANVDGLLACPHAVRSPDAC